ncbi:hypothetical protein PIB30_039036 [Stylosanthes scabra]|uniref:Uncharacterized protein n=1 Tax=Stylosanthes scabra TaxID=79078 RepID=A0ABU6REB4_9FABA|nr:hypothetical protein [Stylosanthes scabra]
MGTESLFNQIHRELSVNTIGIGVHASIFDLIGHEDMPRFKCGEVMKPVLTAEFGAEVAGESERNVRIAAKPRWLLLDQMRTHQWSHGYASYTWEARPKGCSGTDAYTPYTPASLVAVPYRTWFATIRGSIFRLRARGPGDSRIVPVTAGYSWEPGAKSRTPSNTYTNVS